MYNSKYLLSITQINENEYVGLLLDKTMDKIISYISEININKIIDKAITECKKNKIATIQIKSNIPLSDKKFMIFKNLDIECYI